MNQNQTGNYNPLNQTPQQPAAPQMQAQREQQAAPAYTAATKSKKIPMILGVLTIAAFSGIAWVAYESGIQSTPKSAPIIEANSTVVKVKPENPGGQMIPHQDKKVYTQIEKTPTNQKPAPYDFTQHTKMSEAPLESAVTKNTTAAPVTETVTAPQTETLTPKAAPVATPAPAPTATPKPTAVKATPTPEAATPAPQAFSFSSYTAPTDTTAKPAAMTQTASAPTPATADMTYLVQLGAVKSEAQVQTEWQKLAQKFPTEFQNLTLHTEAVTVNGSTLHRVRAGMMTKAQAASMCSTLKQSNVACFAINKK